MKKLPSASRISKLFVYKNGALYWRDNHPQNPCVKAGHKAGTLLNTGYISIYVDGKPFQEHRLVWKLKKGKIGNKKLDHINGKRSDNRIENLRIASASENVHNDNFRKRNITGYKGVYTLHHLKHGKKKYWAAVSHKGKLISLKTFMTAREAALAYNKAALKYHGEFACLNDI